MPNAAQFFTFVAYALLIVGGLSMGVTMVIGALESIKSITKRRK